jgi:hypothetical protein
MTTSIVEYSETEAALATLAQKYKGVVFQIATPQGMRDAKESRKDIATYRIALEKKRVEIKAPALKRTQEIDTEARRITAALSALEDPIAAQIYNEEKKARIAAEAVIKAEQDRIAAEQQAIKDAEEKRMAEQRAEIARQQDAIRKAEAESRAKIEAEERAARMKLEEEARQERLARQAREEVERVKRAEEETRLKAERDKIEAERRAVEEVKRKEQAEAEAKAKAIRDAEEAAQREKQGLANELNDGYEMLATFVRRFGKREEFKAVAAAIGPYLRRAA